jgi:hypothetical protein
MQGPCLQWALLRHLRHHRQSSIYFWMRVDLECDTIEVRWNAPLCSLSHHPFRIPSTKDADSVKDRRAPSKMSHACHIHMGATDCFLIFLNGNHCSGCLRHCSAQCRIKVADGNVSRGISEETKLLSSSLTGSKERQSKKVAMSGMVPPNRAEAKL